MFKKPFIAAVLAALTLVAAVLVTFSDSLAPLAAAKTTSTAHKATVASAVNNAPNLNPTRSVRSFSKGTYTAYANYFDREYNVSRMSKPTVFNHQNQARVYTASPELKDYLAVSMKTWNKALGETVFVSGTKANHTIKVGFGTGGTNANHWDGLYKANKLYINKTHFHSADYLITVLEAISGHHVSKPKTTADKAAFDKYYLGFWESTITHELGHSLGLDHTPYLNDIMYAQSGSSSSGLKYSWTSSKAGDGTIAQFTNVPSSRDINRAKLTKLLGYW